MTGRNFNTPESNLPIDISDSDYLDVNELEALEKSADDEAKNPDEN